MFLSHLFMRTNVDRDIIQHTSRKFALTRIPQRQFDYMCSVSCLFFIIPEDIRKMVDKGNCYGSVIMSQVLLSSIHLSLSCCMQLLVWKVFNSANSYSCINSKFATKGRLLKLTRSDFDTTNL